MLGNSSKIFLINYGKKGKIIYYMLKKIATKSGISVIKAKKSVKTKRSEKIALLDTLDDTALSVITSIMGNNPKFSLLTPVVAKDKTTYIKPLYFCLDKEIDLYAKVNNIQGKENKKGKNYLKSKAYIFINEMEKKHPEIKNAVVNSMLEILPAFKKK